MHRIVAKSQIASFTTQLVVEAPAVAKKARAGQFVIVRAAENGERVPLTIADYDRERGTITMVVQPVGRSTGLILFACAKATAFSTWLARWATHELEYEGGTVVCVGGGVGIAPIYPIARALKAQGNKVITIHGARSARLSRSGR